MSGMRTKLKAMSKANETKTTFSSWKTNSFYSRSGKSKAVKYAEEKQEYATISSI